MISVVINTLNEEKNIKRAINSVSKIADELIVVDMHSEDNTRDIAESLGAKVYEHEKVGYVEPARNYALSKATQKWILILDADEEIPDTLAVKIKQIAQEDQCDYLRLPRKNIIFGKWMKHARWWPDYNIRFFKKGSVVWNEAIHSIPITKGVGADLEEKEEYAVVHHHYESVEQYVNRLNRYTSEHAKDKQREKYQFSWTDLITRPADEFFSRYFSGRGYKDGIHGLAMSLLQAFSELVLYLKLWQARKFEDTQIPVKEAVGLIDRKQKDLAYWKADALVNEFGGLRNRIYRRLKI